MMWWPLLLACSGVDEPPPQAEPVPVTRPAPSPGPAEAPPPPVEPQELTYQPCPATGRPFPVPPGWVFEVDDRGDGACKARGPNIGGIVIGLSVYAIRDLPGEKHQTPSAFGHQLVEGVETNFQAQSVQIAEEGPFKTFTLTYIVTDKHMGVANKVYANDTTGSAFLFVFETTRPRWSADWAMVEPLLQAAQVDPTR